MFAKSLHRRVRIVAGGILGALSISLFSAVGISPAKADLTTPTAPYTPWSSYLAGWTDEYIPTSDNDCVAGRDSCLKETLKELSRIADTTASNCTHDAVFARAYLRMTQLYDYTRDIPGYYQHLPYFNHVDAVFARYYTDAYYNWANGNRSAVPQSWLWALDAAKDKTMTGSGDLLLGMNAHINRDLPFVMAAAGLVTPDGASGKGDYEAVEQWLYDATAPLMAEFAARFDPTMDDSNDPLGGGYWATFQLVSGWRENACATRRHSFRHPRRRTGQRWQPTSRPRPMPPRRASCTQAYTPRVTSTTARDAFCAVHKGDAPPGVAGLGPGHPVLGAQLSPG